MDMNRMTLKVQEALTAASSIAMRRKHQGIDVEHVLLAFLEQPEGLAIPIIEETGVSASAVKTATGKALDRIPQVQVSGPAPGQIHLSQRTATLLSNAETEMQALKDEYGSISRRSKIPR